MDDKPFTVGYVGNSNAHRHATCLRRELNRVPSAEESKPHSIEDFGHHGDCDDVFREDEWTYAKHQLNLMVRCSCLRGVLDDDYSWRRFSTLLSASNKVYLGIWTPELRRREWKNLRRFTMKIDKILANIINEMMTRPVSVEKSIGRSVRR